MIAPLDQHSRLLLLAPHPDDESLAAGGLLQRVAAAGAAVCVLYLTDGENNPWPQRFAERRWSIGPAERRRWGDRRRQESLSALQRLGVAGSAAGFLGFPDQSLTDFLLREPQAAVTALQAKIADRQPTHLVVSSPADHHPDHNAAAVLVEMALQRLPRAMPQPLVLHYVVHGPQPAHDHLVLTLDDAEYAIKRAAVHCHGSQLLLSRRRMLAYARRQELFQFRRGALLDGVDHPLQKVWIENGQLCLKMILRGGPLPLTPTRLYLLSGETHRPQAWWARLPHRSGTLHLREVATTQSVGRGSMLVQDYLASIQLPLHMLANAPGLFLKLERRTGVYDQAGWRYLSPR